MKRTAHSFLVLILFSISLGASAQEGGFFAKPKANAMAAPKGFYSHKGASRTSATRRGRRPRPISTLPRAVARAAGSTRRPC
jgi:hypothetical protein